MVREANKGDLTEILQLYLYLHEEGIPYAFVENVVTHGEYRKKGYATACLNFAKQIAEENHCYKMMLLTGFKEESTLNFYRNAGYNSSDKTAFIQWIDMWIMENDYDI